MKKKRLLPQMNLICSDCELRPSMNHVEVNKDNVTATSGSVLVTHKTSDLFSDEFIEVMPDKFYLHKQTWKELCKPCYHITFEDGLIVQHFNGYKAHYMPVTNQEWDYPTWKNVLPNKRESNPLSQIAINFNLIEPFKKAMYLPSEVNNGSILTFISNNSGILVTKNNLESNTIGLIMPCMIVE